MLLVTADEGPAGLRRIAASAMVDGLVLMDVEMRDAAGAAAARAGPAQRPHRIPGRAGRADLRRPRLLPGRRRPAWSTWPTSGHREIALLGAPRAVYERGTGFAHRTMAGFRDAAESRGRPRASSSPCEENSDAVQRQLVRTCSTTGPALTGLVVHNEAAVGARARRRCARWAAACPRDVSVVAICPDEVAERSTPPLDSVLIPAEEVGPRAVELLMRKIEGGSAPDATLLPPRLTARASTAAARTTVTSI